MRAESEKEGSAETEDREKKVISSEEEAKARIAEKRREMKVSQRSATRGDPYPRFSCWIRNPDPFWFACVRVRSKMGWFNR